MLTRLLVTVVAFLTLSACEDAHGARRAGGTPVDSARVDSMARARQDSANRAQPEYIVDSILPVEEELRRFRAAIGGPEVRAFAQGSRSRDELVRRFVRDLAGGDTADLRAASMSVGEFADLVYPSSPNTHAPYRQAPGLVWMQIQNGSVSGLLRAVRRRGRAGLSYVGHQCNPKPETQGDNTLWLGCTVTVAAGRDTSVQRLFGTIVERKGSFKFVSYKNQF